MIPWLVGRSDVVCMRSHNSPTPQINIVAFVCDRSISWGARPFNPGQAWVTPRSRAELLDSFTGWGHDALKLLSCIESPSAWSIHAIDPPLGSYSRGQVAILGDAAHGMLPHLGAGAGQGIEDALVIVTLLKHPRMNKSNIEVCVSLCLFCFGFFFNFC